MTTPPCGSPHSLLTITLDMSRLGAIFCTIWSGPDSDQLDSRLLLTCPCGKVIEIARTSFVGDMMLKKGFLERLSTLASRTKRHAHLIGISGIQSARKHFNNEIPTQQTKPLHLDTARWLRPYS